MQEKAISSVIVKNTDGKIVGALNMQDLLRAGIV